MDGGPDWVSLPGLPEGCTIEEATAAVEPPAVGWSDCPEEWMAQLPSCRMWSAPPEGFRRILMNGFVSSSDQESYFADVYSHVGDSTITAYLRVLALGGAHQRLLRAVEPLSGPPCAYGTFAFRPGGIVFGSASLDTATSGTHWMFDLSLTHPSDPAVLIARLDQDALVTPNGGILDSFSASGDLIVARRPLAFLLLVRNDGTWVRRGGGTEEVSRGSPENPQVVGEHVFYEDWAGRVRILHTAFDGPSTVAVEVEGGDARGLAVNGQRAAWLQAYGPYPNYDRVEVWTAAVNAATGALEGKRMLGTARRQSGGAAGTDWYAALTSDVAEFFHLDTGEHRVLEPPDGWLVGQPEPLRGDVVLTDIGPTSDTDIRRLIRFDVGDLPLAEDAAP